MSDRIAIARKFIARVRELGANPVWDDVGRHIFMTGGWKLPDEAHRMFKEYAPEIAKVLQGENPSTIDVPEQAPASVAKPRDFNTEHLARILHTNTPEGVDPADWTWFVGHAVKVLEKNIPERAA